VPFQYGTPGFVSVLSAPTMDMSCHCAVLAIAAGPVTVATAVEFLVNVKDGKLAGMLVTPVTVLVALDVGKGLAEVGA
jgi:hypothetical protein